MAIYPGNPDVVFEERSGRTSVHTKLSFGTHTGTHMDAPKHVFEQGISVDKMPLSACIGPCRVLDMTHCKNAVKKEDLERENISAQERILLKTKNSLGDQEVFTENYVYLDGDAADYLASIPVVLLGIDALSVKQSGGEDFRPHTAILEKNIPIIEGLALGEVPAGGYFLVALPLKLQGLDGSPVRAVLLTSDEV